MRSSNPTLRSSIFDQVARSGYDASDTMTMQGTGIKVGILVGLASISAGLVWFRMNDNPAGVMPFIFGGAIVGFILALITMFKPTAAPWSAPAYAIAEGLFLGGISRIFDARFPGLPFQAICLTFGVLFMMALAYQTETIRATDRFRRGMMAAMGAICLVYLVSFVMSLFGAQMPVIHSSGTFGIGFSVVVVVIAALALILDFDLIEKLSNHGAPKSMEWYGAFALMTTLVWLYLEILRLLAKLQSRD